MRPVRFLGLAVLTALLASCYWPAPGYGPDRRSYNPHETGLTVANVGRLSRVFAVDAGDEVSQPIVTEDGVIVAAIEKPKTNLEGLLLRAYDPHTGATRWSRSIDDLEFLTGYDIDRPLSAPYLIAPHEVAVGATYLEFFRDETRFVGDVELRADTRTGASTPGSTAELVRAVRRNMVLTEGREMVMVGSTWRVVSVAEVTGRALHGILAGDTTATPVWPSTLGEDHVWKSGPSSVIGYALDAPCPALETGEECPRAGPPGRRH